MIETTLYHEYGITVFKSIEAALAYGYELYDKRLEGWLVRKRLPNGWCFAFVDLELES